MELYNEGVYDLLAPGAYTLCESVDDPRCSSQWELLQTLTHTCDHCSYLGMHPCDCGKKAPKCEDGPGADVSGS